MYQLFYAPNSASMGVRVLLEEIGVAYELLDTTIDRDTPRPAAQLAINPNGWVPVLVWADGAMYECVAITLFLADRHPESGLAPDINDPLRARFLQTLVYFTSSVQTAFQLSYYPHRFADSVDDEPSAQRRGNRRLRETWQVVNDQIGAGRWVLGERFSAADIYLYMLTTWLAPDRGHPDVETFPHVARVARAVAERATVQRVYGS